MVRIKEMKKTFKTIAASVSAAILLVSCNPYDDSALSGRVDDLEGRVTEIEKTLEDLQTNVDGLSTIVKALEQENRIKDIRPLEDGTGYVIEFTELGQMVIKNGEKPSIGVALGQDGLYYWTVDGEPMLDGEQPIPATIAPEFKVEGGQFWFRVNGGQWSPVAGSDSGVGLIKDIKEDEENVTFILSEGGEIVIPKVQAFRLNIDISEAGIFANSSVSIPYTITAGDAETKVAAIAWSGYQASVSGNSTSGIITVTAPETIPAKADVIVWAVNGKGVPSSKILTFEQGQLKLAKDTYTIGAQGGELAIELETNVEFSTFKDPDPANAWLTIVNDLPTKALRKETVKVSAEKYEGGTEPRTATFEIHYGSGEKQTITVTQLHTVIISGGKADFENFTTEPGRQLTLISDETSGGWKLENGYLRLATAVKPNAESKFPALCGSTEKTGKLSSPVLDGGCGNLTIMISNSKLPSFVPNGIGVIVEILQNSAVVKTIELTISADEYQQSVATERSADVNLAGPFQLIIKNICPRGLTGTRATDDDAYISSVAWTGYSE